MAVLWVRAVCRVSSVGTSVGRPPALNPHDTPRMSAACVGSSKTVPFCPDALHGFIQSCSEHGSLWARGCIVYICLFPAVPSVPQRGARVCTPGGNAFHTGPLVLVGVDGILINFHQTKAITGRATPGGVLKGSSVFTGKGN